MEVDRSNKQHQSSHMRSQHKESDKHVSQYPERWNRFFFTPLDGPTAGLISHNNGHSVHFDVRRIRTELAPILPC